MPKLRVHNFSVSLDGYGAGPAQSLDSPLGVGGERLHEWVFASLAGRRMLGIAADTAGEADAAGGSGAAGGEEGVDDRFVVAGETGIGATIIGRNMFGPVRGPWPDEQRPDEQRPDEQWT